MFIDHSHVLPARFPAKLAGVTVVDVDGDGHFEFFLAAANGSNRVLKWTGTAFRDVAPPLLADLERDGRGCIAADFDGDGREELYLVNDGPSSDRLFDYQPDGWIDLFEQPIHSCSRGPNASRAVAAIDRRGHGRYGFAIAGAGVPLRLLESLERNAIADLAPALGIDLATMGGALAVARLASGRSDLFCANARGPNFLFRNTGLGTFLEVATEHGLSDVLESTIVATTFDDGEGTSGILVANADGPHRLFARRDDGTFRNLASPAMAFPCDARTAIVADFDNDGFEELLFVNRDEPNRFFRQSPRSDGGWIHVDPGPFGAEEGGTGAATADIDRDGRLELLIARGESSPMFLKWPENGNGWLRVRPMTRFGAPARGAVVRLSAGSRVQVRTICGGSGSLCQMEPVAHFGLGRLDRVDSVQITWPDGTLAKIERPAIGGTLEVRYPGA